MPERTRRAFTLVELLIVIAIIALLVALLFPALGKWDELSKGTTCQRNLRDVAQLFNSYAGMNDGRYPYPVDNYYGRAFTGPLVKRDRMAGLPHVKQLIQAGSTADMWYCPFDENYGDLTAWPLSTWKAPRISSGKVYIYIGYTFFIYRGYPYGGKFTDTRGTPIKDNAADDVPLAADCLFTRDSGQIKWGWEHGGGLPDGLFNAGGNTVFKSGAVKWVSKETFKWDEPALMHGSAVDLWWFALSPKE